MPPTWHRYDRDIDGAWHAIDDLRDELEAIMIERRIFYRMVGVIVSVATVIAAVGVWVH